MFGKLKKSVIKKMIKIGMIYRPVAPRVDEHLFVPRWRWNNYLAIREFFE